MHIVEAIVDRRKSSLVGDVLVHLDLALQVIWANGLWGSKEKSRSARTDLRRDPGARSAP